MGYSKIETQYIRKNYQQIFKVLIPNAVGIKSAIFLMQLQSMYQNSFLLDAINCEAIKVKLTLTITTAFLVTASCQKLRRSFFKVMLITFHFVKPVC